MTWVTWRQHRAQAITCLALFGALAIFAIAVGAWMRSTFSHDGLAVCLARSGGAGCPAAITSFTHQFNGTISGPVNVVLLAIPGLLGVVVGALLIGGELERGTWQLAWSQTVSRSRWLTTKLILVTGGLVVFGAAITAVMTWYWQPLARLSTSLQTPPFNFEGLAFTSSLLCAFGLAVLAGLLLRNTIAAAVTAFVPWEALTIVTGLLNGHINIPAPATMRAPCQPGCPGAGTTSVPPATGHIGDLVLNVAHAGNQLVITYVPASRFWPTQFIAAGLLLAITAAALGTAAWQLHRRTT